MSPQPSGRTLFFFEKPSAMRQLQRFFRSPSTVSVAAEGHLLTAEEPGSIRPEWKPWRFEALPIVLETIPVAAGQNRSGQSHAPKLAAIRQALQGVERVIIATDPGREGSMIAWEVLEHLGWSGRVDRLKLGALDDVSIRRAFASLARETKSGDQDYAAYLEALCRQYEDYHLGLNGTRAISLRLRPPAFREPWRFGGDEVVGRAVLGRVSEPLSEPDRDLFVTPGGHPGVLVGRESDCVTHSLHAARSDILEGDDHEASPDRGTTSKVEGERCAASKVGVAAADRLL